jgi:endogenous inhibitor of DNA gyrase (YacG/DUF329 family)
MSNPDPTKEYFDPTIGDHTDEKPVPILCELCGKHDAITEYFEDRMYQYCSTHDQFVDLTEKNEWIDAQEDLREQEDLAFGESGGVNA